jgi:hypothetical protein
MKQIGFDETCLAVYEDKKWQLVESKNSMSYELCLKTDTFPAPTFSQAFRFFREVYGLKHDIDDDNVGTKFYYKIRSYTDKFDNYDDIIKPIREERDWSKIEFYSYEEAELATIVKLIEIVKEKKI